MNHVQIKMPERLTNKDLEGIAHVFSKMSLASKQSFIASIIMEYPEHYLRISNALGENGIDAMAIA